MERRVWIRPLTEVQKFEANEYVAACGDSGVVYKFKCNAGDKNLGPFNYPYEVYVDYNGNGHYQYRANYHACGATHEAESDSGFYKGYMDDERTWWDDHIEVIVWTEYGNDTHCTTELDMDKWETAKS